MGMDPTFYLVMGTDDLRVRKQEIVDPRFSPPPHAPPDLVAEHGAHWWRYVDETYRVPLPEVGSDDFSWNRFHLGMQRTTIREHLIERPTTDSFYRVPGSDRDLALRVRGVMDQEVRVTDRAAQADRLLAEVEAWLAPPPPTGRRLDEVLVWNGEYGCGNVLGFRVDHGGLDTWIWGLCVALGDSYLRSGYRVLPSVDLKDDMSLDAKYLKRWLWKRWAQTHTAVKEGLTIPAIVPNGAGKVTMREGARNRKKREDERRARRLAEAKRKLIKNGWNVPCLTMHVESWAMTAHYLFRHIGLNVRQADLKPMLYWVWS